MRQKARYTSTACRAESDAETGNRSGAGRSSSAFSLPSVEEMMAAIERSALQRLDRILNPVVREGSPADLSDEEIRDLVRAWQGRSLPSHLFEPQLRLLSDAGFVYVATNSAGTLAKVGVSRDPERRAGETLGELYRAWFVGTAALPLEQAAQAILSPWRHPGMSEVAIAPPGAVTALIGRLVEGLTLPNDEPDGWYRMSQRDRNQWSAPIWRRLVERGLPPAVARMKSRR